jgi:hypothetical protein
LLADPRAQSGETAVDGSFVTKSLDFGYFVPGASYFFQYWARERSPASSCQGFRNLSPAYAVATMP